MSGCSFLDGYGILGQYVHMYRFRRGVAFPLQSRRVLIVGFGHGSFAAALRQPEIVLVGGEKGQLRDGWSLLFTEGSKGIMGSTLMLFEEPAGGIQFAEWSVFDGLRGFEFEFGGKEVEVGFGVDLSLLFHSYEYKIENNGQKKFVRR
jgi:hypothetical protein